MRGEPVPKLAWKVRESGASSKACMRVEPVLKLAWRVHENGASSKASMESA
jgi:hypothetical protein